MLRERLKRVQTRIRNGVSKRLNNLGEPQDIAQQTITGPSEDSEQEARLEQTAPEPPVVARLIVEVRSDGTRTVARGALKDELSREQISLEAHGDSPAKLAAQLARSLLTTPLSAAQLAKAMIAGRARKRDEGES